jgi:hypothetical protein
LRNSRPKPAFERFDNRRVGNEVGERRELVVWAESESRTLSNLVMHIVRQALASRDGLMPASSHDQMVERIRNATRNGLSKK